MSDPDTPEARLRQALPGLTPAERQLAAHILGHYPVAVLGPVAAVARAAGVSAPTVVRLVQKLGYAGYPEFQEKLHEEVGDKLASPLAKHAKWAEGGQDAPALDRFAAAVFDNLTATLNQTDRAAFEEVAGLLADPRRKVALLGGRLTHPVATYLATALQGMRGGVTLMSTLPNTWPPVLVDMGPGDVLIAFDIRRYEVAVGQVVELARGQGAEVVLVTDRWVSPAAAHAGHILPCHIEAPSAWDSLVAPVMLAEALLVAVQARAWPEAEDRLRRLEALYARAPLFRRGRRDG
jgi:DNA-binding MurR/RpiR family transcriptional regulator